MSSSSSYNHLVPKLNNSNYATWKTKMEMLLIREGLWSIVSQRKVCPTVTTATESTTSGSRRTRANTVIVSPSNDNNAATLEWDENAEAA
jgi:hypothetical protein